MLCVVHPPVAERMLTWAQIFTLPSRVSPVCYVYRAIQYKVGYKCVHCCSMKCIKTSVLLFTHSKPLPCPVSFCLALKQSCKVTEKGTITPILQIKKQNLQEVKWLSWQRLIDSMSCCRKNRTLDLSRQTSSIYHLLSFPSPSLGPFPFSLLQSLPPLPPSFPALLSPSGQ